MKGSYKIAAQAIGSLVMIFNAVPLLERIAEETGWAAVGLFLLGGALAGAGLWLFLKVDKALSKM